VGMKRCCILLGFLAVLSNTLGLNPKSLKFITLGDWGGQDTPPFYTPIEMQVAHQMAIIAEQYNSQFTLALGDNFYYSGVSNVDDPRFKTTYEQIFTAPSLQSRWYVIAGNHDHEQNVSAQIEYTKRSNRWYFPNYYFTEIFTLSSNITIQFIFIDTVLLCGQPNGIPPKRTRDSQLLWIENTLQNSAANWIFVAGHYPVYSTGPHGSTQCLELILEPLLIKYKVAAYFAGHDHGLQHLKQNNSLIDYYVIGAAHETTLQDSNFIEFSKFAWPVASNPSPNNGGFAFVDVDDKRMEITYFDDIGHILYKTSKTNPRV